MSDILYFYPASITAYRRLLLELSPMLDREGLSFHIARPGESIPEALREETAVTIFTERR